MIELKPGEQTTEFKLAQSAGKLGLIGTVLGLVVAFGPEVLKMLGMFMEADSRLFAVIGAVISVASVIYKTLVERAYIDSRATVKRSFYDAQFSINDKDLSQ